MALWAMVAVPTGILYLSTMAPGLLWGDSGNAQLRTLLGHVYDPVDLSRSHTPYYAVCILLARLGISPARAANLVAAGAGAVTAGNVAWLMALLVRRRAAVVCAAALLALSHALWRLSTMAEVMTFSTMLLSLELVLVTRWVDSGKGIWLLCAAFINGVGFAVHNMALLIWPAYAVLIARHWSLLPQPRWRLILTAIGALCIGASPVIALFVTAMGQTGDAVASLHELLAGRYGTHVYNTHVSGAMIGRMAAYTLYSFPSPLLVLGIVGIGVLWREERAAGMVVGGRGGRPANTAGSRLMSGARTDDPRGGNRAGGVVAEQQHTQPGVFLITAFVCYLLFAIRYDVPDQHVFMLHAYILGLVFVAVGIDHLLSGWTDRQPDVERTRRQRARYDRIVAAALFVLAIPGPIIYAVVPGVMRTYFPDLAGLPMRRVRHRDPFDWFLKPWRNGEDGPGRFARETLQDLPAGALLVVDSTLMPPLLYLQSAEGLRRDVRISGAGVYQPWLPRIPGSSCDAWERAIREGRMYTVTDRVADLNGRLHEQRCRFVRRGVVFRVMPRDSAAR